MKKVTILLCLVLCVFMAGCSSRSSETTGASETSATVSEETAEAAETTSAAETSAESETQEETATETSAETSSVEEIDITDILKGHETFEVSSGALVDGVWSDVISNAGGNDSPDLTWDAVDGASFYVVYMVDLDAAFWMHWKADNVTETALPQGWASKGYVGPYPPEGTTHTYDIYVVALKDSVDRVKGTVDVASDRFPKFLFDLDTDASGNSGNIISYGHLSGEFTAD